MKTVLAPLDHAGIRLRPLERGDLSLTLAWRNRDDVRIWFKMSEVLSEEQHRGWFESYLGKPDDYVFIVEADGRPVGQVALYSINKLTASAEIGRFIVAPGEGGKGHIRVAIEALFGLAREHLGLSRIHLQVFAHNQRAIRLYEKLGFKLDRTSENMLEYSMSIER